MLNIVLMHPEIPQNVGNIGRTCVATNSRLHIIKPMGFTITDARVKRAGLDYWPQLNLALYETEAEFYANHSPLTNQFFYLSAHGKLGYNAITYPEDCYLMFGCESAGLGEAFLHKNFANSVKIPTSGWVRSLNISNAVAIMVYKALETQHFKPLA